MIACVDVDYRGQGALAACLVFQDWEDATAYRTYTYVESQVEAYQSGNFYRRELPPALGVLRKIRENIKTVVVDGYVWLDSNYRPGMGAHLYQALGEEIPVVGVAKSPRGRYGFACEVVRGQSITPLYITSVGIGAGHASDCIKNMHGPYRLPTLLKAVDRLCRDTS